VGFGYVGFGIELIDAGPTTTYLFAELKVGWISKCGNNRWVEGVIVFDQAEKGRAGTDGMRGWVSHMTVLNGEDGKAENGMG